MTRKFKHTRLTHAREVVAPPTPTLGEQRPTRNSVEQVADALAMVKARFGAVDALKASCEPVAAATRLEQSSRFLMRFLPTHSRSIQRDAVRLMLDMLAVMTSEDIAELDRIRRHLRGE